MRQIHRTRPTQPANPGSPLDDPFPGLEESAGLATITHGPYAEQVPIAGMTVATIRRNLGDRYNIPANGLGFVDGNQVDDDTVIRAGQVLTFMHRANAKGSIAIQGENLVVKNPEGHWNKAPLTKVVSALRPRWLADCIWPDGIKMVREEYRGAIVVHQTPPRVHGLRWITNDSPEDYGPLAKYRPVRVAMPYVIVVAVYRVAKTGRLEVTGANECFFANRPLASLEDPLCYPALLNVSRMPAKRGATVPLAWICTQHMDRTFQKIPDTGQRARAGLGELVKHLFVDKFNRSSEQHEGASWFSETVKAKVDPRLASIEAWEQATAADPNFATGVNWLPTGKNMGQVLEHITGYMELAGPAKIGADELARMVVNSQ